MKRIILTTVAVFALAVAGCGADAEQEDFKRDFNAAQAPLDKLLTDSAGASDPASMGKIADGLEGTATKMAALKPPEEAQDELDTFVKEVNASADTMREAQKAMQDQDLQKMTTILTELQKHMTAVGEAQQKLATVVNG
jgi:hypothetical protein